MFDAARKESVHGIEGIILKDVIPKREKAWWHYPKLLELNIPLLATLVCDITNGFDQSMLNSRYKLEL